MTRGLAVGVLLVAMTGLAAERPKVDSPFDLEFGSDAVARRFPAALSRVYTTHTRGNAPDGESWTNWYLRASVDLAKPYHLFTSAELQFRASDEKLFECIMRADCPEKTTREECVKMLEEIVRDMNAHYGLKLELRPMPFDEDCVRDLTGKRNASRSFIHAWSGLGECTSDTNNVSVSVYGMVNGKGGMSVNVSIRDDELTADAMTRRGRFFEDFKPKKPLTLPQGYSFGDVYTNIETTAVIPDCLTNWPATYGMATRSVMLTEKWRDFDHAIFYLSEFGRIGTFAAVLSTNGIDSVEALEKWGKDVLESRRDELELDFFLGMRFTQVWGWPEDFRTTYVTYRGPSFHSANSRKGRGLSAQFDLRRMADGRAFLRVAYSSDEARRLDEPRRSAVGLGVREAVKELLGLDFEAMTTNRAGRAGRIEWERLDIPKGPFTEWRPSYNLDGDRLQGARLRCVYPGDVTGETLSNAVLQVVHAIETKAGVTLPLQETTHIGSAWGRFRSGEALSPDDWFGGTYPTYEASAKVGDMSFEISYCVPQYVKEGDAYRPILKGGFVLGISRELKMKP